jgi:hypothetical protein
MSPFVLEPGMLSMGGVFYPTGYVVVMFPNAEDARRIGDTLVRDGVSERVMELAPETVFREISRTEDGSDAPLPSVGTEGATVRSFHELARRGHHGLLVHANSGEATEAVMQVVRRVPFSFAQKYRTLVIEDLE